MPSVWLLAEVSYEGKSQAGVFSAGQPYIMMGRTNHLAVGITAMHSDTIDLYEETLVEDGKYYMFDGKKIPVRQQKEIIRVRDLFAPSGYRLVEVICNSTHHGPLVHDPYNEIYKLLKRVPYDGFGRKDISMAWSGFQGRSSFFNNNKCLNKAKDVHEGVECFRNLGTQNLNILLADTKGNIGFVPTVSYPIRKHPYAGQFIQDGSKSENDWKGYVPFDEIPKVINPKTGLIAHANSMLSSQNVKYGVGSVMPSTPRVVRINEMFQAYVKAGKKFTAEDMLKMQLDTLDVNAREINYYLTEVLDRYWSKICSSIKMESKAEEKQFKEILKKFRDHMNKWDANYSVNSTQASLFSVWEIEFHTSFLADQIPNKLMRATMINHPDSDVFLMNTLETLLSNPDHYSNYCPSQIVMFGKTYEIKESKCLMSLAYNAVYAYNLLSKQISSDPKDWRWGRIHKHYYEHVPFSLVPGMKSIFHRETEAGGSRRTVSFGCYDTFGYNFEKEIFIKSLFAANFRAAIDMASFEEPEKYPTYMTVDTGASQNPFSKHYFDQNEHHYSTKSRLMELGLKNAKKNAKYTLELIPSSEY